ncbi:MAG: hypothetical protein H0U44_02695 [Flavisolibacter sp.]|jgi:hypothetical protein|nr:hypothetical protein [Flavisolibacter sp.]
MNAVRKWVGLIWILLAIATAFVGYSVMGLPKLASGKQEDLVFGIIICFILLPIVVGGLLVFGYYAFKNEYDIHK